MRLCVNNRTADGAVCEQHDCAWGHVWTVRLCKWNKRKFKEKMEKCNGTNGDKNGTRKENCNIFQRDSHFHTWEWPGVASPILKGYSILSVEAAAPISKRYSLLSSVWLPLCWCSFPEGSQCWLYHSQWGKGKPVFPQIMESVTKWAAPPSPSVVMENSLMATMMRSSTGASATLSRWQDSQQQLPPPQQQAGWVAMK